MSTVSFSLNFIFDLFFFFCKVRSLTPSYSSGAYAVIELSVTVDYTEAQVIISDFEDQSHLVA